MVQIFFAIMSIVLFVGLIEDMKEIVGDLRK